MANNYIFEKFDNKYAQLDITDNDIITAKGGRLLREFKVSVAMVTYNGVKFIEEQLESIINNTIKPDEIVISDDGSTDGSLEVIRKIIGAYSDSGISFLLLTDNPIHGVGTNYEWAYRHTTGDIIFSSGQDDVWAQDKIEKVLNVYINHPDAQVVITDAYYIDGQGKIMPKRFCQRFIDGLNLQQGESIRVERSKYMEFAESTIMVSGPVISFKNSLKELIIPIPRNNYEDHWIEAIGVAENSLYFLMEKTTYYRIHNSVTQTQGSSFIKKARKNMQRAKKSYSIALSSYNFGKSLLNYYNTNNEDFEGRDVALDTVNHIIKIGETELKCMRMGRIKGAVNLRRFYRSDIRYKKSGFEPFLVSLLYIVKYSKKRRNKDIDDEIAKSC